jgi:hypothetical protein
MALRSGVTLAMAAGLADKLMRIERRCAQRLEQNQLVNPMAVDNCLPVRCSPV